MNKSKIKLLIIALISVVIISTATYIAFNKNKKVTLEETQVASQVDKNEESPEKLEQKKKEEEKKKKEDAMQLSMDKHKDIDETKLNTKDSDWYFLSKKDGTTPEPPKEAVPYINKFNGYYVGNTDEKKIYLTFDEGYENGNTSNILDILKQNNVKAAFFVTDSYIKSNKDLVKRMVDEGHIVGNHTVQHKSMAEIAVKGFEQYKKELTQVENTFKEVTGKEMPKFFRPPMGKYSEKSLYYTEKLGYKTIFWSFAYGDYDDKKQPEPNKAKKQILEGVHNSAIYLLHAVSKTNTEILDSVLKEWESKGYQFESLENLFRQSE